MTMLIVLVLLIAAIVFLQHKLQKEQPESEKHRNGTKPVAHSREKQDETIPSSQNLKHEVGTSKSPQSTEKKHALLPEQMLGIVSTIEASLNECEGLLASVREELIGLNASVTEWQSQAEQAAEVQSVELSSALATHENTIAVSVVNNHAEADEPVTEREEDVALSAEPIPHEDVDAHVAAMVEAAAEKVRASEPVVAPQEATPSFLENAWESFASLGLSRFITASNAWALSGIAILLVGLVFFVRYAEEMGLFGPEVRLIFAALFGTGLLVVGWRQRISHRELGLILQGGGVGALYLTVVGGFRLYELLPASLSFVLLVAIVALSTFMALVQNAKIMANVSYLAGFLVPLCVSTGSNDYVTLFSYYVILNVGIVGIARYKPWRSLYLTGFLSTVVIAALWAGRGGYEPAFFMKTEGFLCIFYLIFTYLAVWGSEAERYTLKAEPLLAIDGTLTFGTPLVFLFFQSYLMSEVEFGLAASTLAAGFMYLLIAKYTYSKALAQQVAGRQTTGGEDVTTDNDVHMHPWEQTLPGMRFAGYRLQSQVFLALGIIFANLTLPLAIIDLALEEWGQKMLAVTWAIEGVTLFWLGRKQQVSICHVLGILGLGLSILCSLAAINPTYLHTTEDSLTVAFYGQLSASFLVDYVLFGCFLTAAYFARMYPAPLDKYVTVSSVSRFLIVIGMSLLLLLTFGELVAIPYFWEHALTALFIPAFFVGTLRPRLKNPDLFLVRYLPLVGFSGVGLQVIWDLLRGVTFESIPFSPALIWAAGLSTVYLAYETYQCRASENAQEPVVLQRVRVGLTGLLTPCLSLFTVLLIGRFVEVSPSWERLFVCFWPFVAVFLLTRPLALAKLGRATWLLLGQGPLLFMLYWVVCSFFKLGPVTAFPFIPILNPLELTLALVMVAITLWGGVAKDYLQGKVFSRLQAVLTPTMLFWACFALLNVSVVRFCVHWLDMPFTLTGALRNPSCQALFVIVWGGTGFLSMFRGHRLPSRRRWFMGATLLVIDVLKLVFIDFTRMETIWRIVACLLIGGALIVIGYYFPLPPAKKDRIEPEEQESDTVDETGNDYANKE